MSEARIQNWHRAICDHVPQDIEELRAEIAAIDTRRAECVALINDLEDFLAIARRRLPEPSRERLTLVAEVGSP